MRIKLFALSLLLFGAMVLSQAALAQDAQPKYGVVDIASLMRDSVPGKEGVKFIETQQAAMQKQLDEIQGKLEKDPENKDLMQQLQRVYATAQQKMQAEGQHVANLIYDSIQKVLNDFRKDKGYAMLVSSDALASFDPAIDVTKEVLAEVDKLKLEFKPLPVPPAPQKEETAPAKEPEQGKEIKTHKPQK